MSSITKPAEFLEVADLEQYSVWRFINDDLKGETLVKSVKTIPVKSLTGKIVGVKVSLADGTECWALIANVDETNIALTEHFITISIHDNGKWYTLSRYHDFDYKENGPMGLSKFLGKAVEHIFPISYDIRQYALGDEKVLVGKVQKDSDDVFHPSTYQKHDAGKYWLTTDL